MKLFIFLQVSVVLRYALKSEFVRGFNEKWFIDVLLLENFNLLGISGAEKSNLRLVQEIHDHLHDRVKILGEEFVHFVKN